MKIVSLKSVNTTSLKTILYKQTNAVVKVMISLKQVRSILYRYTPSGCPWPPGVEVCRSHVAFSQRTTSCSKPQSTDPLAYYSIMKVVGCPRSTRPRDCDCARSVAVVVTLSTSWVPGPRPNSVSVLSHSASKCQASTLVVSLCWARQ